MCNCEDRPCCGCDAEDNGDSRSDQEIKDAIYANDDFWYDEDDDAWAGN